MPDVQHDRCTTWLVAGLGNPGKDYAATRHNIGFQVADVIAARHQLAFRRSRWQADAASGRIGDAAVVLVKPTTFMNLSGEAVRAAMDFYKLPPRCLIVVYDDLDLPLGRLRIRAQGSAGGHNGLKSIIHHLHTDVFLRVRIGIGRPPGARAVGHVLSRFLPDEQPIIDEAIATGADAVEHILREGPTAAMNRYNIAADAPRPG